MIKADNGEVELKGFGKDLLVDFMMIAHALLDNCGFSPAILKYCLNAVIKNNDIDVKKVNRDLIKEILRGKNGEEIMQDIVNIMMEVVEEND